MATLKEITSKITKLKKQQSNIQLKIQKLEDEHGICCLNCANIKDMSCNSYNFPNCFIPNQVWIKKHKDISLENK
jgi:hypothetical protein